MRTALSRQPARQLARHLAVALLSVAPLAAGTGLAAEPGSATTPAAAKPVAAATAAKPPTATAPKPATAPQNTAPKPTTATAPKPATAPQNTVPKPAGAATPATARPTTAAPGAPGQPKTTALGTNPTAAPGTAAISSDPAKDNVSLIQATSGIKGIGTLFATIEIAVPGKTVQALHCELFADKAPLTVANFIGLARGLRPWKDPKSGQWVKKPLYDNNLLHRVVPELLIQGGDPGCSLDTCRNAPGSGEPGYTIADEFKPELRFDRAGRLAMANRGPGTSGSQFFITERDAAWLNGSHTIFGQCDGPELVTELAHVDAGSRDQPKVPLVIKRVTFMRKVK